MTSLPSSTWMCVQLHFNKSFSYSSVYLVYNACQERIADAIRAMHGIEGIGGVDLKSDIINKIYVYPKSFSW